MLAVDRAVFFGDLRARTGLVPGGAARSGLGFLLDRFEADAGFSRIEDPAYVLATIRWETGEAFQPVRERRASRDRNPRLWRLQNRYWSSGYYGRGYVQLTWKANYRRAGQRLAGTTFAWKGRSVTVEAETLLLEPDLALLPAISYAIVARGMREGWFTGKKLADFIRDGEPPDYAGARRIVGGMDQAGRIADYANGFELVLRAAMAGPGPQGVG